MEGRFSGARIPDDQIERLKNEVSLERPVTRFGIVMACGGVLSVVKAINGEEFFLRGPEMWGDSVVCCVTRHFLLIVGAAACAISYGLWLRG